MAFYTDIRDTLNLSPVSVAPTHTLALDQDWAGAWYVMADVNQDGVKEIVTARVYDKHDVHHTVSCAAYSLHGETLWQWGEPSIGCGALHSDVACQVADVFGTGELSVVLSTDTLLVILDARTGREQQSFPLPEQASDSIFLTDLTQSGTLDIIVKDRYLAVWAFDCQGTQLWHIHRPGGSKTCHHPIRVSTPIASQDLLILGFACFDLRGRLQWDLRGKGVDDLLAKGHLDCARVIPGEDDILMTACGANALLRVSQGGAIRWVKRGLHYESIQLAQLDAEQSPCIVVDIAHQEPDPGFLEVCSLEGDDMGRFLCHRSRQHRNVRWQDARTDDIVVAQDRMVLDGKHGAALAVLEAPLPAGRCFDQTARSGEHALLGDFIYKVQVMDIDGDGRDEILLSTNPGNMLWVYDTPHGTASSGSGPHQTNVTLY